MELSKATNEYLIDDHDSRVSRSNDTHHTLGVANAWEFLEGVGGTFRDVKSGALGRLVGVVGKGEVDMSLW